MGKTSPKISDGKPSRPLEVDGIHLLAKERPDILAIIISENFLPPSQLAHAIDALGTYVEDPQFLLKTLTPFLEHYSDCVVGAALRALGMGHLGGIA